MAKPITKTRGAVIVTRVSTGEQATKGTSLEEQMEACRAKAEALNLPIIGEYEDGGVSGGFLLTRAGMQAAIADIREGRADTLICASMSRYSRDEEHQAAVKKAIRATGGRVVFCDIDLPDTPEGDLAFGLMGQFAAYERRVIRERTMKGRRRFAMNGVQTARGWSPYGYNVVKHADVIRGDHAAEQLGKYVVLEHEAEVVRWLFESYASGEYSLPGLVCDLNRREVPTKQGAPHWHPPTIRNIFNNPVYIGKPQFGKMTCRMDEGRLAEIRPHTGEHYRSPEVRRPSAPEDIITLSAPPLVDQETWDRVHERLATNKARRGGNPSRVHMLSGTVVCEHCGSPMYLNAGGDPVKGYPAYYQCGDYKQHRSYTTERPCVADSYKVPVVEEAVVRAIEDASRNPEWIAAAIEAYVEAHTEATPDQARRELSGIDRAIADLAANEAAAVQGQIAGIRQGASPDAYACVFADLAARRKDLEDRRGAIARTIADLSGSSPKNRRLNRNTLTEQAWADLSLALRSDKVGSPEKRQIVTMVVEKVYCKKDGGEVYFLPGLFGGAASDTLQEVRVSFLR